MNTSNWEHVESLVEGRIDSHQNHLWPFQSSFPIDVRSLILDRRENVPLHRPDHLEVVLSEWCELGYEVGNNTYTLAKNDIIVVGNRNHHRCLALRNSQQFPRTIVLAFLPQTVHSGTPLNDDLEYLMPFNMGGPTSSNIIRADVGITKDLRELIGKIQHELPGETGLSRLAIRTYLKMILLYLTNHCAESKTHRTAFNRQKDAADRLTAVFDHIQSKYHAPIRVSDVARISAISTCGFMNLFKEVTGQSFVRYLNRFRVAKAQDLLSTTNKTISEIGLEVGFCSQSYFGVVFRRVTGLTPFNYRLQSAAEIPRDTVNRK